MVERVYHIFDTEHLFCCFLIPDGSISLSIHLSSYLSVYLLSQMLYYYWPMRDYAMHMLTLHIAISGFVWEVMPHRAPMFYSEYISATFHWFHSKLESKYVHHRKIRAVSRQWDEEHCSSSQTKGYIFLFPHVPFSSVYMHSSSLTKSEPYFVFHLQNYVEISCMSEDGCGKTTTMKGGMMHFMQSHLVDKVLQMSHHSSCVT